MKKITVIFVALLLAFNSVGMLFYYFGQMRECKSIASEKIADKDFDSNSLQLFSSDETDFQLLNNKEIQSDGKLYDIVRTERHNGRTIYYTINDSNETEIINHIAELSKTNSDNPANPVKENAPDVLKYIAPDKTFDFTDKNIEAFSSNVLAYDFCLYNSPNGEIDSPPPQDFIA